MKPYTCLPPQPTKPSCRSDHKLVLDRSGQPCALFDSDSLIEKAAFITVMCDCVDFCTIPQVIWWSFVILMISNMFSLLVLLAYDAYQNRKQFCGRPHIL